MNFETACRTCHVRGGIYRKWQWPRKLYAKNHEIPLKDRVPAADQLENDWEEWDEDGCDNISTTA
jgi:hypothetical protein